MQCPACKSELPLQEATSANEVYKCSKCGATSIRKYSVTLLLVLALIAAPIFDFIFQFSLELLASRVLDVPGQARDAIAIASVISTTIILIIAYIHLRRLRLIDQAGNNREIG